MKVDGDTVTQTFTGGKISWNRATNSFTTEPANLAGSLSGLQVPAAPAGYACRARQVGKGLNWHWWWLLAIIPALLLSV